MANFFQIVKINQINFIIYLWFFDFVNWSVWIYAIATKKRIIDASFGYFIMPIIN